MAAASLGGDKSAVPRQARFNSADLNVAYRMDVGEYQRLCPYAEALEENWGKPPGAPSQPASLDLPLT